VLAPASFLSSLLRHPFTPSRPGLFWFPGKFPSVPMELGTRAQIMSSTFARSTTPTSTARGARSARRGAGPGGALARRGDGAETRRRLRSQGGRYHESSAARRCFITTARGGTSSGGRDPEVERFRHKETAAQERRNKVVADDSRPRSPCILSELCHSVCSGPAGREGAGNWTGDSCRWRRGWKQ